MPNIQSYQVQGSVTAMDRDSKSRSYAAGSREWINIFQLNVDKQYWFDSKINIKRVPRNESHNIPMVFDLAWNKDGKQYLAVGTTSGSVYVLDLDAQKCSNPIHTQRSPENISLGTVKRIVWKPNSTDIFYALYQENYICRFDHREKSIDRYGSDETNIKYKDLKFNPFDSNIIAVGEYSDQIKLFDIRKMKQCFIVKCRNVSDQMGSIVDWDPFHKNRLASAGRKQINFWTWEGSELIKEGGTQFYTKGTLKQQMLIDHYQIKSFKFLQSKPNYYAISEQYIYFYNMKNTDYPERIYGGNSKSVDCWLTDHYEQMIVSASQPKTKTNTIHRTMGAGTSRNGTNTVIVAQYQNNFFSANEERQNHPIAFDSDNSMVFSWKNKGKPTVVTYQGLLYQPHGVQQKRMKLSGLSIKQQLQYLDAHYIRSGKEQNIAETNSKVALQVGKKLCSQMWLNIFPLAFPKQSQPHTITSLFEEQLVSEAQIINNCLMTKKKNRVVQKFDICSFLQEIVDQGQLQTAVIATICLNHLAKNKNMEQVVPKEFMQKIIYPYVEILSSLQMYVIATHTLIQTDLDTFKAGLKQSTTFSISCGVCKANFKKSEPHRDICSAACLDCRKILDDRFVICCIYCGHGGHADEFKRRVERGETKCLSCEHQCFIKQEPIFQHHSQSSIPSDFQTKYD